MSLRELHQVDRGGIDRQVDDHAAAGPAREQRGEDVAIIVSRDRVLHEADLPLVEQVAVAGRRVR